MAPIPNPRVLYKEIPEAYPIPGETLIFEPDAETIDLETAPLNGGVLVKVLDLSLDPYMRWRMRDPKIPSYAPAWQLDQSPSGGGLVKVLRSEFEGLERGDHLALWSIPWKSYAVIPPSAQYLKVSKVANPGQLPWSAFIGIAGMPGRTAFYSLKEYAHFGKFKEEGKQETIFVTTAAGTVGGIVVQLAKLAGLKVIGSTGSDDKVSYLKNELGADVAFNYKTTSVWDVLKEHGPVDVYYDNVGGEQLDAALKYAREKFARFIMCGQASEYNNEEPYGIKNMRNILTKSIQFNGFLQQDLVAKRGVQVFTDEYLPLVQSGKLKFREHKTAGLKNLPQALVDLLQGKNEGKSVIVVAND